jgi:hypothetical protein|tara:strand:- start:332 stop:1165 length:834 start_codon:yes stop_codon:yes gene_type:complete
MKTEEKLAEMLTTSTGVAMCDSGDAYSRHWSRNQDAVKLSGLTAVEHFMAQKESIVEFNDCRGELEIDVTHNVFHWLRNRLHYDVLEDEKFREFGEQPEHEDKSWLEIAHEYVEKVAASHGIYGDATEPASFNTYNGECLLSQTLQFYLYQSEDNVEYVLLQIHQGCDVRGGYTRPVVFEMTEDTALFENAQAYLSAENTLDTNQMTMLGVVQDNAHNWFTDDAYHWYADGCSSGDRLDECTPTDDESKRGDGEHVYIDEDGNGYSPRNGAKLEVSS